MSVSCCSISVFDVCDLLCKLAALRSNALELGSESDGLFCLGNEKGFLKLTVGVGGRGGVIGLVNNRGSEIGLDGGSGRLLLEMEVVYFCCNQEWSAVYFGTICGVLK